MNQYIITYDELIELIEFGWDNGYNTQILVHQSNIMSRPYQSEWDKVLDEMLAALQNEGMAAWDERGYMRFIQSFLQAGEP